MPIGSDPTINLTKISKVPLKHKFKIKAIIKTLSEN
jgi:hypothetical protein